ncbi:MAG TPA: RsmE family RNA methyltransferase [Dehalococcoidia bacterium]|nr:RsmE family RNA methyltransferase [Dehalococcoidia bacterium]
MSDELRRFFVPRGSVRARNVTLGPEMAHRLGRVLRMKRGDHILLSEGGPRDFEAQITGVSGQALTAVVVAERDAPHEPSVAITLYQSLIRQNRFDLVLEKGTELGVSRFVPMTSARSQHHGDVNGETSTAKAVRWGRIVLEAAEQCGRGQLPEVAAPQAFEQAVRGAQGLKLLPYESARGTGLTSYLRGLSHRPAAVSLFIGPEGGFETSEIELADSQGAVVVTMGPRVMRSETAGIVAAALVLDALGEMA